MRANFKLLMLAGAILSSGPSFSVLPRDHRETTFIEPKTRELLTFLNGVNASYFFDFDLKKESDLRNNASP